MKSRRAGHCAVVWILLLLAAASPRNGAAQSVSGGDHRTIRIEMLVFAPDREVMSESISEWATARNGYFTYRSLDRVVIRIPNHHTSQLHAVVSDLGGEIVLFNPATTDVRAQVRDAEAAITSRREALERILMYLGESDVTATLAFESELRSLNQEIEHYEGRLRALRNDIAFALVEMRLSVRDRQLPAHVPSSFHWINSVDLYRFVDEIHRGAPR